MTLYVPDLISNTIQNFTGRTWLLQPLKAWLADPNDQLFVLKGGPGTGKSMICAWLAGLGPVPNSPIHRQQLEDLRAHVAAVHFCLANSGNTSPRALARNLAEQLEGKVEGFTEVIAELDRELTLIATVNAGMVESGANVVAAYINHLDLGKLSDQQGFNRLLREPLQRVYKKGFDKPIILVIDALDEAETYTGDTKIGYLLSTMADLPPQVKVLATTRDDPRVRQYMDISPFDLVKDAPAGTDDIETYAHERLQTMGDIDHFKLAARIGEKANGVFLYAYLVIEDMLQHPSDLADIENLTLPEDLYDFYRHWLNRELGKDRARWVTFFKPFLGVLAVAQGDGLSRVQLEQIVGDNQDIELALWLAKQYLTGELPNGPFRLSHWSFVEFLLDKQKNLYYPIDAIHMHRQIVKGFRQKYHTRWDDIDEYGLDFLLTHLVQADIENRLSSLRGDRYALRHLLYHMMAAHRTGDIERVIELVL